MKADRTFFDKAYVFVREQVPLIMIIEALQTGDGYTNFRAPAIYVAVPLDKGADHAVAVCALFHEYGHWLDMERWAHENQKQDPLWQCAREYHDHLEKLGVLGWKVDKKAQLKNEEDTWRLGDEGLTLVDETTYLGLASFCQTLEGGGQWLSARYCQEREKRLSGYREARVRC